MLVDVINGFVQLGSASIHAPHRRGRSTELKNRNVTSSIDRLAAPKSRGKSMDVLAASGDGSRSTSERRTPERTQSMKRQTTVRSNASPGSDVKSMPVTLKPLAKLTKPPHATAKISHAKVRISIEFMRLFNFSFVVFLRLLLLPCLNMFRVL